MPTSLDSSLTGSPSGKTSTHLRSVSLALGRLRFGVLLSAWIVGLALLVQLVIWSLVTFTDMRWTELTSTVETPVVIVQQNEEFTPQLRSAAPVAAATTGDAPDAVDPNRVPSRYDRIFATASSFASGFGVLGCLCLLPLMTLGVLLATSSATKGGERTVSAFGWSLITVLLVLPLGEFIGLPWRDGALWSYERLITVIDGAGGTEAAMAATTSTKLVFYAQFLVLPLVCMLGLLLCGSMLSSGIEAGLLLRENLALDEALELEAGNTKAGSLHAGRSATALQKSVVVEEERATVKNLGSGDAPRRLI